MSLRFIPPSRFDVKNQSTASPIESKTTVSGIGQREKGQCSLQTIDRKGFQRDFDPAKAGSGGGRLCFMNAWGDIL